MKKCILKSIVWLWLLCIISIGNAGTILAENGRTLYQVRGKTAKMLPEEKAAIGDLCHYLKLISGADFAAGSHKKYQIIIGKPAPSDKSTLKKHERRIVSENNDIYIWGEGRYGNVNAVYDFLKDIMRCRWFTVSGDEMIPRQQRIELDDLDYSIIPTVPKVTINQFSLTGVPALVRFARRHGLHTRADGFIGPTGHAIRSLLPCGQISYGKREGNLAGPYATLKHKAYFKTNPEFFSMNEKGKRVRGRHYCFSNPELRKEFVKNISKVLTDAGYDGSPADFSIGHDDRSGKFCYCQACLALEKQYDHCAGAYFDFVFYVADRIGKKYPNIMLNILAYRKEQTLIPPSSEKIKSFPMNVTVCYAPLSADFSKPYTHPSNRKIADLFKAWGKVAHNIRWSAYPTTYPRPTFNFPLTANIRRGAENINFACANGIVSAYLEFGAGPADAFGFNDLRLYIYSEKLRDINADENVLIREFTDACYGQAAPALRKYLAELEKKELATKKFMRWNPQVLYVDYASAENLLKWTADFKQMEKSVSAPRHLLNLRRARFTLDQTIIARWPYFTEAEKQKFGDLEKIIKRCEKTIFDHNTDIASSFRQSAQRDKYIRLRNSKYLGGLDQLTGVARGGKPLPEFMQKKKTLYRILPNRNKQALTPDPQAAFGLANFAKYPENNRSIFTLHYYRHGSTHRPDIQKIVNRKRIEKRAKDNNYHWYHLGAVPLSADAVLMFDGVSDQSNFPLGHLYAAENPGQLYDLYVSCAADKAKGILRIDQLVVIPLPPRQKQQSQCRVSGASYPGRTPEKKFACPGGAFVPYTGDVGTHLQ